MHKKPDRCKTTPPLVGQEVWSCRIPFKYFITNPPRRKIKNQTDARTQPWVQDCSRVTSSSRTAFWRVLQTIECLELIVWLPTKLARPPAAGPVFYDLQVVEVAMRSASAIPGQPQSGLPAWSLQYDQDGGTPVLIAGGHELT